MTEMMFFVVEGIIGGIVGILFYRIQKKIDRMEADQTQRQREQVEIRTLERELLLAEADVSALTARCVRGEAVNGDLDCAFKNLTRKKNDLQSVTRKIALEYIEGDR